jgi:hypothetical protein
MSIEAPVNPQTDDVEIKEIPQIEPFPSQEGNNAEPTATEQKSSVGDQSENGETYTQEKSKELSLEEKTGQLTSLINEKTEAIQKVDGSIQETKTTYDALRKELGLNATTEDPPSVITLKDKIAELEKEKKSMEAQILSSKKERGQIFLENPIVVDGASWKIPDELLSLSEDELVSIFFSANTATEERLRTRLSEGSTIETSNPEAFKKIIEGIEKGLLAQDFKKLNPQELESLAATGHFPDGKEFSSKTMGIIDPDSVKKLAAAFGKYALANHN